MQTICTSLQTDNHTNTSSLNFTGRVLFLTPNQQCQSTEGADTNKKFKSRNKTKHDCWKKSHSWWLLSNLHATSNNYCVLLADDSVTLTQSGYTRWPSRPSRPLHKYTSRPFNQTFGAKVKQSENPVQPYHHPWSQRTNKSTSTLCLVHQSYGFPLSWLQKFPDFSGSPEAFSRTCHKPAMLKYSDKQQLITIYIVYGLADSTTF